MNARGATSIIPFSRKLLLQLVSASMVVKRVVHRAHVRSKFSFCCNVPVQNPTSARPLHCGPRQEDAVDLLVSKALTSPGSGDVVFFFSVPHGPFQHHVVLLDRFIYHFWRRFSASLASCPTSAPSSCAQNPRGDSMRAPRSPHAASDFTFGF